MQEWWESGVGEWGQGETGVGGCVPGDVKALRLEGAGTDFRNGEGVCG